MAKRKARAPKRVRQQLSVWEEGAFLFATFISHWKAGFASLLPFAVIYFTVQPLGDAIQSIAMGGYTIAPVLVAIYATGWAAMSYGLLHLLRRNERAWFHYAAWTVTGAVTLFLVGIGFLSLVTLIGEGSSASPMDHKSWDLFLWATPLLGAFGAFIGRFVLRNFITWHITIDRKPLPNVFEFVPGKRDKREFEKL